MIKNLIFDFGNVLFDLDLPRIQTDLQKVYGEKFETAVAQLRQHQVFELYETGGLSSEEFVAALANASGTPVSHETIVEIWNSIFLEMPYERFEMLQKLRQRYKIFMLSNINEIHADWIDDYMLRTHNIQDFKTPYFDGVYYSHLIRLRKPNADAYEYVLADAEIKPEESLFIDDLKPNIEAAENVGIQGLWHPLGKDIVEHLREVGILVD